MGKKGAHWYRNNELNTNKLLYDWEEIPEGYTREAYSKFQSEIQSGENNPWYGISRKGEDAPNYGKRHSEETKKKISESNKGKIVLEETRKKMSESAYKRDRSNFHPNHKGENNPRYGTHITLTDEKRELFVQRRYETMKKNNSFNKSGPEEDYYKFLLETYLPEDIKRQYSTDKYPFKCDFYIISEDKYIECNYHWTHGGKPFDPNDKECQEKLATWKERSERSKFYANAIKTWTVRDVEKQRVAKENNLNIEFLYQYDH